MCAGSSCAGAGGVYTLTMSADCCCELVHKGIAKKIIITCVLSQIKFGQLKGLGIRGGHSIY